jgi:hypothetical protein
MQFVPVSCGEYEPDLFFFFHSLYCRPFSPRWR